MWARKRSDRWRRLRQAVPALAGSLAGLWLLFAVALFVRLGQRAESLDMTSMERWRTAANASLRLFASPFELACEAIAGDTTRARAEQAAAAGIPTLRLAVAPQHVEALDRRRQQAIRDGILCTEAGDFVPGWAEAGGGAVRTQLRLKGDWIDHLAAAGWSLRVKVRDGGHLFGMRTLSLHAPRCRGGHGELLLLDEMRRAGVLAPRSFPVHVRFNDRDFGIMLAEEHFGTQLIEAGRRRAGVVVGFDEDVFWRQRREFRRRRGVHGENIAHYEGTFFDTASTMAVRVFDEDRVWQTPALRRQAAVAVGMLRAYLDGRLDAESVFDLRLWARHRVLTSVWGATHGLVSHNLRIYFNPLSRRLEPIAFDNNTTAANLAQPVAWAECELLPGYSTPIFRAECRDFASRYAAALAAERAPLLQHDNDELTALLRSLDGAPEELPTAKLLARCRELTALPLPVVAAPHHAAPLAGGFAADVDPIALLKAYWVEDGDHGSLELVNPLRRPVVVESIHWRSSRTTATLPVVPNPQVPASGDRQHVTRIAVPWSPTGAGRIELVCHAPTASGRRVRQIAQRSWPQLAARPLIAPVPNLAIAAFERDGNRLVIPRGAAAFPHGLITPVGLAVHIEPGARLTFGHGTRFIVRGPLTVAGTPADPVLLEPVSDSWAGLVVLGNDTAADLRSMHVRGTAARQDDPWAVTGGVTLHRCRATLRSCRFTDNSCEDALNLVACRFDLGDCEFARTASDATDVDFGSGSITHCRFETIGGDAIDVSGSRIELVATSIRGARDKAVSIGERSTCAARELRIDDVGVAVAVKDGSTATLRAMTIGGARVAALMAYVKKPAFGGARIEAHDLTLTGTATMALAQHGSTIVLDGEPVASRSIDVAELYRTSMRKAQ